MRFSHSNRFWLQLIALAGALSLQCFGAEVAVLRNGFSIRHERREIIGSMTRMYVSADGASYVDVPTAEIEHFEAAPPEIPASISKPPASADMAMPRPTQLQTPPSVASTTSPQYRANLSDVINEASGRYRLDPDLVNSVIKAESGFNTRAVSPKGAQGLMQLMPGTASVLGVPNAFDPQANVDGGARYLRELLERYNFDLVKALAAYNAGPMRVEQYGGVPPYYETRAYVRRIVVDFNKKKIAQKSAAAKAAPSSRANAAPSPKVSATSTASAKAQTTQ